MASLAFHTAGLRSCKQTEARHVQVMTPRWYRSGLFWFGLPGFLYLLWNWGAYLRTPTSVSWGTQKAEYCLGWGDARIGFVIINNEYRTNHSVEGPDIGFISYQDTLAPADETRFFAPALDLDDFRIGIHVGSWVAVSLYVVAWLGGVAIWQRRRHRWMGSHKLQGSPDHF